MTPSMLNTVWIRAARLAFVFALKDARNAVMVVPMFSPNTTAAAVEKSIHPAYAMARVIAIAALDDWTMTVRRVPTRVNSRKLRKP